MLRYGLRTLQLLLGGIALMLLAQAISPLFGAEELPEIHVPAAELPPERAASFEPYRIVGQRNLFNSRETAPAPPPAPPPKEEIEESSLRLRLLGTIAATTEALSVATVEDQGTKEHMHVRVGDPLGSPLVRVARIEPKQLVIDNKGRLEAITMDEAQLKTRAPRGARRRGATRKDAARRAVPRSRYSPSERSTSQRERLRDRVRRLTQGGIDPGKPDRAKLGNAFRALDAAASGQIQSLLQQVRFEPSFSGSGQIKGIKITEVIPGSALAKAGLEAGVVVTSVNDVPLNGPGDLPGVLSTLRPGETSCLDAIGPDGQTTTHCWGG